MGLIITNLSDALDALDILCPSTADPVLTTTDTTLLLDGALRAVIWTTITTFDMGAVVMPTVRNGRRYRLIAFDGTGVKSGVTEPTWPAPLGTANNFPVWGNVQPTPIVGWWRNAIVTDGHITWMEDGADYDSLWDIGLAAFNGWMMKASRAVCAIDIQTGKMSMTQSQIYDHCLSQAQRYAPVYVA